MSVIYIQARLLVSIVTFSYTLRKRQRRRRHSDTDSVFIKAKGSLKARSHFSKRLTEAIFFWKGRWPIFLFLANNCGATGTPLLDFWWRLLWILKPEWALPYLHLAEAYIIHSLRSTCGATHCQPLDNKHCRVLTRFISCPRILPCSSSESRTCDHQIMSSTC